MVNPMTKSLSSTAIPFDYFNYYKGYMEQNAISIDEAMRESRKYPNNQNCVIDDDYYNVSDTYETSANVVKNGVTSENDSYRAARNNLFDFFLEEMKRRNADINAAKTREKDMVNTRAKTNTDTETREKVIHDAMVRGAQSVRLNQGKLIFDSIRGINDSMESVISTNTNTNTNDLGLKGLISRMESSVKVDKKKQANELNDLIVAGIAKASAQKPTSASNTSASISTDAGSIDSMLGVDCAPTLSDVLLSQEASTAADSLLMNNKNSLADKLLKSN